jgi:hypothetical protein
MKIIGLKGSVLLGIQQATNNNDMVDAFMAGAAVLGSNNRPRTTTATTPNNTGADAPPYVPGATSNTNDVSPVRTGEYQGGRTGADETNFILNEVQLAPRQGILTGEPEVPRANGSPDQTRSINRQNEAAQTLSHHGLSVEQLPNNQGRTSEKQPDLRINGELADVYSPTTGNVQTIRDKLNEKANPSMTDSYQAPNVVINLADSPLSASTIAQYIQRNPVPGLKSVIIIKNGTVTVLK